MEVSYTMLKTFMDCEYSYFLRYVQRVPISESSASVYGTVVHRTIKDGYLNQLDRDEWIKVFKNDWLATTAIKDIIYYDDNDYLRRLKEGQKVVGKYYDKFVVGKPTPPYIEYFFSRSVGVKLGEHTLIGVFDQVDDEGRVIDYKTGVKPTRNQLDFDLQFTVYSYAYRYLFGKSEKDLVLLHLNTGTEITTSRTQKDFDVLLVEIDKIAKRINSTNTFIRNINRRCGDCYFLEACLGKSRQTRRRWFAKKVKDNGSSS